MELITKLYNYINIQNLRTAIRIFYVVLKKDYSKYPYYLKQFEKDLSKKFNSNFALSFSSGTASFYASIKALNLKKKSNILISTMTFSSVSNTLKNLDMNLYYYDVDKNFNPDFKNSKLKNKSFDLIVVTHPFGFLSNFKKLNQFRTRTTKLIFDCSHVHGLKIDRKDINNFCDIAFYSIQGNKALSGGEGGFVLTNDAKIYLSMINNHHPNHEKNTFPKKYTGLSNDIKLRMHPIASIIAKEGLKTLDERNNEVRKKIQIIYAYFKNISSIEIPGTDLNLTAGYHYGIPFYIKKKKKLEIKYPIVNFNWKLDYGASVNDANSYLNRLYFIELNWVKINSIRLIKNEINNFLKNNNLLS